MRGPRGAILSFAADPGAPGTLYAGMYVEGGRRLWKSVDGGRSWRPASAGIPQTALVLRLVPDPAKPGTLYAATDRGVYAGTDGGGGVFVLEGR